MPIRTLLIIFSAGNNTKVCNNNNNTKVCNKTSKISRKGSPTPVSSSPALLSRRTQMLGDSPTPKQGEARLEINIFRATTCVVVVLLFSLPVWHGNILCYDVKVKGPIFGPPKTNEADKHVYPVCYGKKRFILIGDSTMARARDALLNIAFQNCTCVSSADRCDFPKFYGLPYNKTALELPIPPYLGPMRYGKENRGCYDCSGCASQLYNCVDGDIEFHGIEFAADVEYPTDGYSLTQESIISGYMSLHANLSCDFVVFSFGIHDTVTTGVEPAIFGEQLDYVCELLLQLYRKENLLYVTSTYPKSKYQPTEWRNITSPHAIHGLNQISRKVMRKRNIKILDVAEMSNFMAFEALHTDGDGVHIGPADGSWYRSVAFSIYERSLHRWS